MMLLLFARRLLWSRTNPDGGTTSYYYNDAVTWIVVGAALLILTYFVVRSYRRKRAQQRPQRGSHRHLRRTVKAKRELSRRYLRPGFSNTIHAVGIGRLANGYCIQVFVSDASGGPALPATHRGIPLVMIEMPVSEFLSAEVTDYGRRERQEVILGGLSGANTNLTGECGTIGYFCTRKSRLPRRKEVYLLSNSHVFVDLLRSSVDERDLIVQPSPAESASNRPIASLVDFSPLRFDNLDQPNHVDAAIARLWNPIPHRFVIPLIGAIRGVVRKQDVEPGELARKFGRTTGYTEGCVFSIYLDLWVRYDRTGQSAFFQDQILVAPALSSFTKFAARGDSGSMVVDAEQHALGLIFAGMTELPQSLAGPRDVEVTRIESYGVAHPITEVLSRLGIELLT